MCQWTKTFVPSEGKICSTEEIFVSPNKIIVSLRQIVLSLNKILLMKSFFTGSGSREKQVAKRKRKSCKRKKNKEKDSKFSRAKKLVTLKKLYKEFTGKEMGIDDLKTDVETEHEGDQTASCESETESLDELNISCRSTYRDVNYHKKHVCPFCRKMYNNFAILSKIMPQR